MKKVALVGYGKIARKHVAALRRAGCEIVASCNRSEAGNQAAKTEEGIPRTFFSATEMVEQVKPEGILVCAAFDQVYSVAKDLLSYRIPLLLEKPTGTCLKEHLDLVELARLHHTPVQVALNRRHYSVLEKAVADAGGLDAITSVVVEWSERPEYALRERNYSPIQVSQLIISDSIHGIDLMLYLAGKCKDYKVLAIEKSRPFRWLMNISGISERKVLFNFHSSWDNPVPWRVVLHAHRKRYVFAPLETCLAFEEGKSEPRNLEPAWYDMELKAGFFVQSQLFLELMDGKPNPHDLDSATPAIQMSDRLMQAFDFSSRLLKNPV